MLITVITLLLVPNAYDLHFSIENSSDILSKTGISLGFHF